MTCYLCNYEYVIIIIGSVEVVVLTFNRMKPTAGIRYSLRLVYNTILRLLCIWFLSVRPLFFFGTY